MQDKNLTTVSYENIKNYFYTKLSDCLRCQYMLFQPFQSAKDHD